jgi:L-fuconolactonase
VVGWVQFDAPNAPERIRALVDSSGGRLKGLRPMVQDIADPNWVLQPQLDASFEAMIERGLAFDALVKPQHLQAMLRRLRRHPRLKAVIDHAGKPNIAGGEFSGWADDIERLANETSACCKLSGLVTEGGTGADLDALDKYVAHVLACFGPKRVLWGSDWPVLNRVCSYGEWLEVARELVQRHAPGDDGIFGANAIAFYSLAAMPIGMARNRAEVSR